MRYARLVTPEAWHARGRTLATRDGRIFLVESGKGGGVPILVLHGFPTSSFDFADVIDPLASERRVIAFDFLGYGYSEKPPDHAYSLMEQADVAIAVARDAGLKRAHVWAHDMGTSVATELLARRERDLLPFEIESLVLMNGSVHIEMASLTVGQKLLKSPLGSAFARLNNRTTFKAQMRRVFAKPPRDEELEAMWALLARENGARLLHKLIGYTAERSRFALRWVGALERLNIPTLVAWGARDPVAVLAIADKLASEIPGAEYEKWPDLGHYPQVEDPPRVARTVAAFFAKADAR
jgi:pimeloyl-ACP methyl ester carboxylesterase